MPERFVCTLVQKGDINTLPFLFPFLTSFVVNKDVCFVRSFLSQLVNRNFLHAKNGRRLARRETFV